MLRNIFTSFLAAFASFGLALADDMRTGSFVVSEGYALPITVHFVEPPEDAMADAPVVIVMHGVYRNADEYAANWVDLAREYGLRVYAPEFSAQDFPGADFYNLGGIGTDGPYAYQAIEPIFTAIAARGGNAEGYVLFGHSAGAQFVHRALLFESLPRLTTAYAANAGWYTLPDDSVPWPYGLSGLAAGQGAIAHWISRPMVVLLGDQDTDPADPNLRHTPEADAQGPHRLARGIYFAAEAQDRAQELDMETAWRVVHVPGVAHDNAGMAEAAAALISQSGEGARR
ncbi:MAG: alpha/beta hydrolase [Maricaulis sp.]|jgi:poly(3-hydroxybutyrate) depolymerase|nr:alpha/beta hydrolase [Maricaulis sp.]HAQ36079.1 alpha/beta hydrolase [Alphaproteobacteria bacterium]